MPLKDFYYLPFPGEWGMPHHRRPPGEILGVGQETGGARRKPRPPFTREGKAG